MKALTHSKRLTTGSQSSRGVVSEALRSCAGALLTVGVFSLALNFLMLTVPLYMMQVYDRVLSSRSEETLLMLTVMTAGLLIIAGVLESVRLILMNRSAAHLEAQIGGPLLKASIVGTGTPAQGFRVIQDLAQLRQFVASPLVCTAFDLLVTPLYICALFMLHSHLGWITVTASALVLLVSIAGHYILQKSLSLSEEVRANSTHNTNKMFRGAETIRVMGMFANAHTLWTRSIERAKNLSSASNKYSAIVFGTVRTIRLMLQICVLGYGALLVLQNDLSPGVIIAASIISTRALSPLDQLMGGWGMVAEGIGSFKRLSKYLASSSDSGPRSTLEKVTGKVQVERLFCTPGPSSSPILKNLNFTVNAGQTVGIIGPSGAGKTTLSRLLVGAIPATLGVIRIDGADISSLCPEELGSHVGYMSQEVSLFPGTVAENIARLAADPDPEKIVAAATFSGCHEMIQRLPNGYGTQVEEGTFNLSTGQKQRIALARAFYGLPKIVILDEPNSHLDAEGDEALSQTINRARNAGISCILTTQRTSIARLLDQIICLADGSIQYFGPATGFLSHNMNSSTFERSDQAA